MSSNIHQDVFESNSNSSSTSEQTEVDSSDDSDQPQKHNNKKQENLSVQRSFISTMQLDGVEDLSQFDVQAYDQQTYEEGVFEQVDKALQKRAPAQATHKPATSSNFLQFLQEKDNQIKEESTTNQSDNNDYGNEILESTKLEAQKQNIKTESTSKICELLSSDDEIFEPDEDDIDLDDNESYEYETDYSDNNDGCSASKPKTSGKRKIISTKKLKLKDDGDTDYYVARMKEFAYERAKEKLDKLDDHESQYERSIKVEGTLSIPENLWNSLFEHQKIGVKWFWELHQLGSGGILGDEMGLGKTIQMIAFFVALKTSSILDRHTRHEGLGPVVLVCPATVMHQWLYEFRRWYPPFRVAILHNTGSFTGKKNNLIDTIYKSKGILIVSFSGVVIYQDSLHNYKWHYAVLDEGHKIRNPDAQVTLACKRFRTPHRIILSGSPVQNNLRELWSVFDFIYPGKLGTLPVFMDQFATPITQGGYANATDTQVQVAYKCACVLRDTIKAYLLRRSKAEINSKLKLPDKSEQVLFCKLTEKQRSLYSAYLKSPTIRDIKRGACQIFVGLIELRKICNHPDLFDSVDNSSLYRVKDKARVQNKIDDLNNKHNNIDEDNFGDFRKSGKMLVVDVLLKLWKKQGNKVLLFSQSRQMLRIFSSYLNERQYSHLSMDGQTPIGARQALVDKFNKDLDVFVFLLTTRVGGVGVNLVGANRIIIFDPDWNPSTDIQARERAWRIGQTRDVIIYRLITAGTIEEKIYHRQVFKLYLTNRILRDTKQKRFFKTNDLHELFTLGDDGNNIETKALFEDDVQIKAKHIIKGKHKKKKSKKKEKDKKCIMNNKLTKVGHEFKLSDSQKQAIMERARAISKKLSLEYNAEPKSNEQTIQPSTSTDTSSYAPIHECSKKSKSKKRHFVEHLVKQDIYKESDKKTDNEDVDEYVLKKLFKKSNIFGALKHDKIESDQTSDYKLVENEANKIAQDAIRSLKESRQYCLNSSTGVPNWTGRNGFEAPRQENRLGSRKKNRFQTQAASQQVETSSLLSAIKSRTFLNPNDSVLTNDDDSNTDTGPTSEFHGIAEGTGAEIIASKLRNFMMFESPTVGESQTNELLDFFKKHFSISRTAVFKAILYKMCVFERRGSQGFWSLKSEFRV